MDRYHKGKSDPNWHPNDADPQHWAGILNIRWGLGTEYEQGYRTGPPRYIGWRIDALESIPGLLKSFKIQAQVAYVHMASRKLWVYSPVPDDMMLRETVYEGGFTVQRQVRADRHWTEQN